MLKPGEEDCWVEVFRQFSFQEAEAAVPVVGAVVDFQVAVGHLVAAVRVEAGKEIRIKDDC